MPFPDCRLYLLFTPDLCAGDPWTTLALALDGGVDAVQWRVKGQDRPGFVRCREVCQQRRVPLFVNDDVMLAVRGQAAVEHDAGQPCPLHGERGQHPHEGVGGLDGLDDEAVAATTRHRTRPPVWSGAGRWR